MPCTRRWLRRLHLATGRLLADLTQREMQSMSFNMPTTQAACKELRKCRNILKGEHSEFLLTVMNRDVAGFFTAVPHTQLSSAVKTLLEMANKRR